MQSIFRLPWSMDQMSEKVAMQKMHTSPLVEIPALSKLKRKRTGSSDATSPHSVPSKKARFVSRPILPVKAPLPENQAEKPSTLPEPSTGGAIRPGALPRQNVITEPASAMNARHHLPPYTTLASDSGNVTNTSSFMSSLGADVSGIPGQPGSGPAGALQDEGTSTRTTSKLLHAIENAINMQILMKHQEERLIEQELAKCQVALEQLRRCEVRPFPGSQNPSQVVSAGTGPAIEPQAGFSRPSHPAPYGVTDGPFTRHYAQWLLPGQSFDAALQPLTPFPGIAAQGANRPIRKSVAGRKSATKSTVPPRRGFEALHSIPNYPVNTSRDKEAPLVLRRPTDGQLVKLICNNCNRGNFNSVQGFLNHCRIAHKVDYKSHDAAALDCGQPLEEHESKNLPHDAHQSANTKPASIRKPSAHVNQGLVHPLNQVGAPELPPTSSVSLITAAKTTPFTPVQSDPTPHQFQASVLYSSPLVPCAHIPYLSAHFAKRGLGGNLERAAAEAKQKLDIGFDELDGGADEMDVSSPIAEASGSRTALGFGRAGMLGAPPSNQRPPSRKGHRVPSQRARPSPLAPSVAFQRPFSPGHAEIPESPQDHDLNFSPQTADSTHGPPELVSDHDDDAASEEEEAATMGATDDRPPSEHLLVEQTCGEEMEIDVAIEEHHMDDHGLLMRPRAMMGGADDRLRSAGSPSRRPTPAKR